MLKTTAKLGYIIKPEEVVFILLILTLIYNKYSILQLCSKLIVSKIKLVSFVNFIVIISKLLVNVFKK